MRSLLFVPGDSARKFKRALESGADALILDLEDSVAPDNKIAARAETRRMLAERRAGQDVFVRINAVETGLALDDLAAVMPAAPTGIVLPKCAGGEDVGHLGLWLDAFEAAASHAPGSTRIIAIATETAASIFGLGGYKGCSKRLSGLMWGAEDLSASLGATENGRDGAFHSPYRLARDLCLMGAAAAEVAAIDTVHTAIDDLAALEADARAARRDGFAAKALIHPKHVAIVNAAFAPSDAERDWAAKVIAAFADNPGLGVVRIDGRMIDKPHLRAARKVLGLTDEAGRGRRTG